MWKSDYSNAILLMILVTDAALGAAAAVGWLMVMKQTSDRELVGWWVGGCLAGACASVVDLRRVIDGWLRCDAVGQIGLNWIGLASIALLANKLWNIIANGDDDGDADDCQAITLQILFISILYTLTLWKLQSSIVKNFV